MVLEYSSGQNGIDPFLFDTIFGKWKKGIRIEEYTIQDESEEGFTAYRNDDKILVTVTRDKSQKICEIVLDGSGEGELLNLLENWISLYSIPQSEQQ